jgi:acetyl esterase/lipase
MIKRPLNTIKISCFLALTIFLYSCRTDLDLIVPQSGLGVTNDSPLIYEERLDISYGNSPKQNYDLYIPSTKNKRNPVFVLLHPGAWKIGDKNSLDYLVKIFIEKRLNCAIVNANYRLTATTGITYLQQTEDINLLLKKLKSNSDSLGISNNFFLVGVSAGGHLAMLYANSSSGDRLAKAVAGIVPPVNLASESMRNGEIGSDIRKLIGKPFEKAFEEYYKASPIFQFNISSPPTIVFFAGKDTTVPKEQADICKNLMLASRIRSEYIFYPDLAHEWPNKSSWEETASKIISFAEKNL